MTTLWNNKLLLFGLVLIISCNVVAQELKPESGFEPLVLRSSEASLNQATSEENPLFLTHLNEGLTYLKKRDYRQLQPDLSDSYLGEGITLVAMRKFGPARQAFKQALEVDPDNADARFNLGITCYVERRRDCALQQYNYLKIIDSSLADKLFRHLFSGRILDVRTTQAKR